MKIRLLQDKIAIITGSNRGIGKATLEVFAENGADIIAHARKKTDEFESMCQVVAQKNGVRITPIYYDAVNSNDMKEAVAEIKKITKKIDILVNNLGTVNSIKLFQMTSMEEMRGEFDVNYFAQIEFSQYISRFMQRNKSGSIINVSSCAGIDGNTGMLSYVSSKAALIGATKRMAIELGPYNIRVNTVAPGLTETDMGNQMSTDLEEETLRHVIFKRKGMPREVANTILFLGSDLSEFITGQVLRVDGGMLL